LFSGPNFHFSRFFRGGEFPLSSTKAVPLCYPGSFLPLSLGFSRPEDLLLPSRTSSFLLRRFPSPSLSFSGASTTFLVKSLSRRWAGISSFFFSCKEWFFPPLLKPSPFPSHELRPGSRQFSLPLEKTAPGSAFIVNVFPPYNASKGSGRLLS